MRKRLWTLIFFLCIVFFSAYGIAGTDNHGSGPLILSAMADPPKVYPNQTLKILVEVEDSYGIETATAEYFHEKGSDTVDMMLIAADDRRETYQSIWTVHDTLLDKYYNTKVTLINKRGQAVATDVEWQDPEIVTHTWSNISGSGYCIFWNATSACPDGFDLPYDVGRPYLVIDDTDPGCNGCTPTTAVYFGVRSHSHLLTGTTQGTDNGQRAGTGAKIATIFSHTHNLSSIQTSITENLPPYKHIRICCKE